MIERSPGIGVDTASTATGSTVPAAPIAVLTVADVVADPIMQRGHAQIVAGQPGLTRPVRWIHVTEYREIAAVLRGGELLLTTGMLVPRRVNEQARLVSDLVTRGVAGLVIELGSVLEAVPAELCQAADAAQFPVIALKRPIPFVSLTEALHPRIAGVEVSQTRAITALRGRLTDAALQRAGAAELVSLLAGELSGPAWVTRADGTLVYRSEPASHPTTLTAPISPDANTTVRAPVSVGGDPRWGELCVEPSPLLPVSITHAATREAAAVISLVLMRTDERYALTAAQAGAFLVELAASSSARDELELHELAVGLGMPVQYESLLPVVIGARPGHQRSHPEWITISNRLTQRLRTLCVSSLSGTDDNGTTVVCALRGDIQREAVASALAESLHDGAGLRSDLCMCVGRAAGSWHQLSAALRATRDALSPTRLRPLQSWHDVAVPSIEDLLWALRDQEVVRSFVDGRLESLAQIDRERGSQLLLTLEVFCRRGGHKTDAARELNLERQSLYKRLARIEQILQVSLDAQETLTELHLAILGRRFFAIADR